MHLCLDRFSLHHQVDAAEVGTPAIARLGGAVGRSGKAIERDRILDAPGRAGQQRVDLERVAGILPDLRKAGSCLGRKQ